MPRHIIDRPTLDKLAKGRLPIEGRVDLHGMSQDEAYFLLHSFLQRAHAGGMRYVLVITGKGSSSGGDGMLRRAVPAWLATPPFRLLVSSHDERGAQPWRRRRALRPAASGRASRDDAVRREAPRAAAAQGVTQKQMAAALGVSAAYLSALEHGRRGARPGP